MRIESEGEGVQVRGDVAGAARISVVTPCASDVCRPLDHHKVFPALLLKPNCHPQSGESRPQDGHTDMTDTGIIDRRLTRKGRALLVVRKRLAAATARKNWEHDRILQ